MPFSYDGDTETDMEKVEKLYLVEDGKPAVATPIRFKLQHPTDPATGEFRDQKDDAVEHMIYAHSLNLPTFVGAKLPKMGRAIIVGGAPSIANHLDEIREFSKDPDNAIFVVNWSHTWLIDRGVIPTACVFWEIDAEPDTVLTKLHPDVTYYVCTHCHDKTYDALKGYKTVVWRCYPNSPREAEVGDQLFPDATLVGGGIGTFTRTLFLAINMGYRNIEIFGCDSSFPDDAESTHVKGYQTENDVEKDAFFVYAKHDQTGKMLRFKTVGYLAMQVEEFKEVCRVNHYMFACRVHGNSLLRWTHKNMYPDQYPDGNNWPTNVVIPRLLPVDTEQGRSTATG